MTFEASKRPFGHPVPVEAIRYFCHPREGHRYHLPAWGRDGKLYAGNCWVAVRFFGFSAAQGTGTMEVVDALGKLPWHDSRHEDAKAWRRLDDVGGDLFREGLLAPWRDDLGAFRADPPVRVANAYLVPAAAIQMIYRLPRVEVYTTLDRSCRFVPFRFNGGEGLVARLSDRQEDAAGPSVCHIFSKQY